MNKMLTAKDVQELLQVDRSTVYRMAEDGRIPAFKVGKQWRFPAESMQEWLGADVQLSQGADLTPSPIVPAASDSELANLLPLDCVQLIQDSHADLLGAMLIITDLEGKPVTQPSNPCGLFTAISEQPDAIHRCISSWHDLGETLNIEPAFQKSHLGLLCARGLIRVGRELPGMVVAGCIAPVEWPPTAEELEEMARAFGVETTMLVERVEQVYRLDDQEQEAVLASIQRVANIIAHIVQERQTLLGKLDRIADLARL
jgi:excisionase family DNA binding protein